MAADRQAILGQANTPRSQVFTDMLMLHPIKAIFLQKLMEGGGVGIWVCTVAGAWHQSIKYSLNCTAKGWVALASLGKLVKLGAASAA